MTDTALTPVRRPARLRRLAIASALVGLLAWAGWRGYVRATTRPIGTMPYEMHLAELASRPPNDVKDAFAFAIDQLPAYPYRSFILTPALYSDWNNWSRPLLVDIERYLKLRGTAAVMDRLAELSEGNVRLGASYADHDMFGTALELFLVRARYRWESQKNEAGAVSDLQHALRIAVMAHERPELIAVLSGSAIEEATLCELTWLASLASNGAAQLATLRALADDVYASPAPDIAAALEMTRKIEIRNLDGLYIASPDGDGPVDVQALSLAIPNYGIAPGRDELTDLGGIWNVLSFAFHGRKTVVANFNEQFAALSAACTAHGDELTNLLERIDERTERTTLLDGPLTASTLPTRAVVHLLDESMRRAATCTAIAIEQFRKARGDLPESLEELVPEFLETLPQDRYVDAPLRYRREGKDFVLYSVGRNRRDDIAHVPLADLRTHREDRSHYDVILRTARPTTTDPVVWLERLNASWPEEDAKGEDAANSDTNSNGP